MSQDRSSDRKPARRAPNPKYVPSKRFGAKAPDSRGPYGRPAQGQERRPDDRPKRQYGRPAPEGSPSPKPFERRESARPEGKSFQPARSTGLRRDVGKAPFAKPAFGQGRPGRGFTGPRPATPRQEERPAQVLSRDARMAAFLVLGKVLVDDAYAALSLNEVFGGMRLKPLDKRLATAIVYKTLEDLYKIDHALGQFLNNPTGTDPKVMNILRLSACQILLMDKIPDFAVVNEAVELTRSIGLPESTGLVNGVLRSLLRGQDQLTWPKEGEEGYDSVRYSMPDWLIATIQAAYPAEDAHAILSYRSPDNQMSLRPNLMQLSEEQFDTLLASKPWEITPGSLPGTRLASKVSDIGRDPDFLGGRFSIQGEGSMMAVLALSPQVGKTVLDCCAAPGGKTSYLAELMQNTGRIHAWDVHEHRVELIQAQAERLRLYNIRPAYRDAAIHQERFDSSMDQVLLDAPCSGTGVMHNKPDIKYRLSVDGLQALLLVQKNLLDTVSRYVKPGGLLVYSTCSLLPAENQDQVSAFLKAHPDFHLEPLPDTIPQQFLDRQTAWGLQLLPHRDQVDGFFIARLRRSHG